MYCYFFCIHWLHLPERFSYLRVISTRRVLTQAGVYKRVFDFLAAEVDVFTSLTERKFLPIIDLRKK